MNLTNLTPDFSIKYIHTSNGLFITFLIDFIMFLLVLIGCCFLRQYIPIFQSDHLDDLKPKKSGSGPTWTHRALQWCCLHQREYTEFAKEHGKMNALYLYFEKTVIIILFFIAFFTIVVSLPLHLSGNVPRGTVDYAYTGAIFNYTERDSWLIHTTVSMISESEMKMMAPVVLTWFYVIIICTCMIIYTCSQFVRKYDNIEKYISSYTIQIKKVGNPKGDPNTPSSVNNSVLSLNSNNGFNTRRRRRRGMIQDVPLSSNPEVSSSADVIDDSDITTTTGGEEEIEISEEIGTMTDASSKYPPPRTPLSAYSSKSRPSSPGSSFFGKFDLNTEENLIRGFQNRFDNDIYGVRMSLKTHKRNKLQRDFVHAEDYLKFFQNTPKQSVWNIKYCCFGLFAPVMCSCFRPWPCKASPNCCGYFRTRKALRHYESRLERVRQNVVQWERKFQTKPKFTGDGHLIFKTVEKRKKWSKEKMRKKVVISLVDGSMQKFRLVKPAREPTELVWEHFTGDRSTLIVRTCIVHFVMIFYVFLFTSPFSLANSILTLGFQFAQIFWGYLGQLTILGDVFIQYLPTLLLYVTVTLIPHIIPYLTNLEKPKYMSTVANTNAIRIYTYQILTSLILPTLLLTSSDGLLKLVEDPTNIPSMLTNMYLPSSGAFFLNYFIHFCFLTLMANLMNIGNLVRYIVKKILAVTDDDKEQANNSSVFYMGQEFAYIFQGFGIVLVYSLFCPLLVLVGLFFFFLKYWVDRANISGVFTRSMRNIKLKKVKMDVIAYKLRVRLIFFLMFSNVFLFETFTFLFFLKLSFSKSIYYVHLAFIVILIFLTAVYCFFWVTYFNIKTDENSQNVNTQISTAFEDEELRTAYHPPFQFIYHRPREEVGFSREEYDEYVKSVGHTSFLEVM